MIKEKKLSEGTPVLIFKHYREKGLNQDNINYILGTVQNSYTVEEYGNIVGQERQFYSVLGEDGQNYFGTYGTGTIGGSFFRTLDDQVEYLKDMVKKNQEKIMQLRNENETFCELATKISMMKELMEPSIMPNLEEIRKNK